MDLYDVMRTTPAVREFTDDPLPDETLHRILDHARFAPSGGNRQGTRVVVVRDRGTRLRLADLNRPAVRRYVAQIKAGWETASVAQFPAKIGSMGVATLYRAVQGKAVPKNVDTGTALVTGANASKFGG